MDEFLKYQITQFGTVNISVYNIVTSFIALCIAWIILVVFKRIIYGFDKLNDGRKYSLYRITKYIILVCTIVIILKIFGVDITLFIAGSAALLVGLGLGIQGLFNDFISGIELLIEGTVKVNDVIEVEGIIAKVLEIGLRTSYVVTNDGVYIIIPNSVLTSNKIINWTHSEIKSRFHITVGVAYGTDVDKASLIMVESAKNHPLVSKETTPFVRFIDFGDSALILDLLFWSNEVFIIENIKSDIRKDINRKFIGNNIVIPFPQRTLHYNPGEFEK